MNDHACHFKIESKSRRKRYFGACACGKRKSWPTEPQQTTAIEFDDAAQAVTGEWYERFKDALALAPVQMMGEDMLARILTEDLE